MQDFIVMVGPDMPLEPERMHKWRVRRKSLGHAMHTCAKRFRRHAKRGRVYRVTGFVARHESGPAFTRRVRY